MKQILAILCCACCLFGQAVPVTPNLPTSVPPSAQPTVTGTVRFVHDTGNITTNGTNLQTMYTTTASCGDQIVLDAGIEYRNNFVFNKQCNSSNWVQVVSANLASIPTTAYVSLSQANNQNSAPTAPNTANFAKLTSGNGSVVMTCTNGSNVPGTYNYFGGLEVTNTVASGLAWCTNALSETLVGQMADHIIFDRFFVHGITGSNTVLFTTGFLLAGGNVSVVNSYVSDIYSYAQDSQAILLAYGPGPFYIHNNFLEGASENIMAGGTGKTPGFSCTIAASPAPTTTTATVNTCIDSASGAVATPPVNTCVMFYVSSSQPFYTPDDWTCITGNSGGALTFKTIPNAPLSGAAKIKWGIVPSDITITQNVIFKSPTWNPTSSNYDGVGSVSCTVVSSAVGSATVGSCISTATGSGTTLTLCANPGDCGNAGESSSVFYHGTTTMNAPVTSIAVASSNYLVTFTSNLSFAPDTGSGKSVWFFRDVKDLIESKYGARWLINGNLFQHVWNGGQGLGFNLNATDQNGDCPWCTVQDITMTNNIWQDLYQTGAFIPAQSYTGLAPGALARVLIKNNLFWPQYSGLIFGVADYIIWGGMYSNAGTRNGIDSLQIIHNHMIGFGTNLHVGSSIGAGVPENYTNLVIKDNVTEFDQYRWLNQCISGNDGSACINSSLNTGSTSTISNNAVINSGAINGGQGISDSTITSRYGSLVLSTYYDAVVGSGYSGVPFLNYSAINTDYHNFALTGSGPWINAASDGTNPGVNFTTLDAAIGSPTPPSPAISCPSTTTGIVGTPLSTSLVGTSGTAPLTYSIISGPLPPGLSLNSLTGAITGTPTMSGTLPYTAKVTDAHSLTATTPCSFTISASTLTCDLNHDGQFNVLDVRLMTNQVLGVTACTNNLTMTGSCNVTDIQRVTNAALLSANSLPVVCPTGP